MWLRMFFKHRIKVYVQVDEHQQVVTDDRGMATFCYQNVEGAAQYKTLKSQLTLMPGAEPCALREEVLDERPKKAKKADVASGDIQKLALPEAGVSESGMPHTITVYTDGGASPNPGPAGCGILMMCDGHVLEIWEYLGKSTNNVAELTAILRALEHIKNKSFSILLYSDSAYAIGVLSGQMKATKNLELIERVRGEMAKCPKLKLLKVKAHVGIAYNEHVDKLVGIARESRRSGKRRNGVVCE